MTEQVHDVQVSQQAQSYTTTDMTAAAPDGVPMETTMGQASVQASVQAEQEPQSVPQSAQQRHENAARRRRLERKNLTEQIRAEEAARYAAQLASLRAEIADESVQEDAATDMPQPEQQTSQPDPVRMQAEFEAELGRVRALNPAIRSLADLQKTDRFAEIYGYVMQNGLSLDQAYRLAYGEQLQNQAVAAARQQALNAAAGTAHLGRTISHGAPQTEVPAAEMAVFREMFPELSAAQIRQWYTMQNKKQ